MALGRIVTALVVVAALVVPPLGAGGAAQAATDVGYRDFSYSGASAPTGQKPESKLWYTADGTWWGSLFNATTKRFEIYKFNRAAQKWSVTGVAIDERKPSEADALYDPARGKLYIVTHLKDTSSLADRSLRFIQYSYSGGTFVKDAGFPVTIATINPEAAVFDKDTTGTFWVTWTEPNGSGGRKVRVAHSTSDSAHWAPPYDLTTDHAGNLGTDEISALVAYNHRVGIMWGNEVDGTLNFASHKDGDPDSTWNLNVLCDFNTFGNKKCPDDHFNLKSLDSDSTGRVFAVVKTSLNDGSRPNPNDPLQILWTFNPAAATANGWSRTTVWTVADNVTRAILLLDTSNKEVYVFSAAPCCSGGTVYMKKSRYNSPSFTSGLGTVFIQLSTDTSINNVTSTKQSVNSNTGLLVVAGDDHTKYYVHNYLDIAGSADTTPPDTSITSGPDDGSSTSATSATFTYASTEANSTFQCALDAGAPATCPADGTTLTGLAEGSHTFTATATDAAGNTDPTPATRTWTVTTPTDTTPPDTSITSGPDDGSSTSATSATFTYASTEANSTFQCALDAGAPATCPADGTTLTGLAEGSHTFTATATDAAGNTDPTPATRTWTVTTPTDTTPPDTSITSGPADGSSTTATSATFTYASTEANSTFQCALDASAPATCPPDGTTLTGLAEGSHTFTATATDAAGNTDPTPATRTWTVTTPTAISNLGEVGRATSTTSGKTLTITTTQAASIGSRIVVAVGYSASPGVSVKVQDSAGNSYSVDVRKDNGTSVGTTSAIASSALTSNLPATSTITITLSSSVTYRLAAAFAYAGVSATDVATAATGTSATPASGTITTAVADALVLGVTVYGSGTASHAPGSGWSELAELHAGTKSLAVDEQVVSTIGSYGHSGTLSSSALWTDCVVSYR